MVSNLGDKMSLKGRVRGKVFILFFIMGSCSNYLQPHSSEWHVVLLGLVFGLPLIYELSFLLSEFLRRTPISVILTGRRTIFKTTRLYKAVKSIKCFK